MLLQPSQLGGMFRQLRVTTREFANTGFRKFTFGLFDEICSWGITSEMTDSEKKKLAIFNQLNVFQFLFGLTILLFYSANGHRPITILIALLLPALVSVGSLVLNKKFRHNAALFCYFLLYPIMTSQVYMRGGDFGLELNFILFGILSVFFLQQFGQMLFSIGLSMVSYFVLSVIWKDYTVQLEATDPGIYLFIQIITILLIFYGLFLIKKENAEYQFRILAKNHILEDKNLQIQKKNKEIRQKALQLEEQTKKLEELDVVKNKLFSVIAHDLKAPVYALKNLFQHILVHDLPAEEIKQFVPDVVTDLNHTTELMENLLQWAKSQLGGQQMMPSAIDLSEVALSVRKVLRPQAEAKQIIIDDNIPEGTIAYADKDMVSVVLRNLISNAIKYTPNGGIITINTGSSKSECVIRVIDTGVGMNADQLEQVNKAVFYTSKGTNHEAGTGLGLMLCREFITKNAGRLMIQSKSGKGSIFSFTLPLAENMTKAI